MGCKPGVCLLFALLMWVLLFEFCSLCVSEKKLSVGDNVSCGWEKACVKILGSETCTKYKDAGDPLNENKDPGNAYIGFGILAFFLIIAMIPVV